MACALNFNFLQVPGDIKYFGTICLVSVLFGFRIHFLSDDSSVALLMICFVAMFI